MILIGTQEVECVAFYCYCYWHCKNVYEDKVLDKISVWVFNTPTEYVNFYTPGGGLPIKIGMYYTPMGGSTVINILVYTPNVFSPATSSICLQTSVCGSPKNLVMVYTPVGGSLIDNVIVYIIVGVFPINVSKSLHT